MEVNGAKYTIYSFPDVMDQKKKKKKKTYPAIRSMHLRISEYIKVSAGRVSRRVSNALVKCPREFDSAANSFSPHATSKIWERKPDVRNPLEICEAPFVKPKRDWSRSVGMSYVILTERMCFIVLGLRVSQAE
jgi:hypothetical protein